jgi:hypothetical protein
MRPTSLTFVTLCASSILLAPSVSLADDPVVKVDCLCASEGEARVEGLMLKPWYELMNTLDPVVANDLNFVVAAVNPPGEHERQACAEVTKRTGKPYAAVSGPIRMKLDGFEGIVSLLDYQSSYYGPMKQ